MLANIIPIKKMPRSLSVLSYKIPRDLGAKIKIGQLVNIPLRNSITTGIVYNIQKYEKTSYALKSIINLVNPRPIFTSSQLELFYQLANYYYLSASLFVHFNLPKLIKKDWSKLPSDLPIKSKTPKSPQAQYLWWATQSQRNKFYLKQIQAAKKNKSQLLIVVPRINHINLLAQQLKLKKDQFIPIHRQLSRSENFKVWLQAIKQPILIGTRSSLFYPFTNLKTIIVDDEHSIDHKQYDMNPRYEVKIAAEYIGRIYKTKIILSSPSPSLIAYHQFQPPIPKSLNRNITLVDLENELIKKNYSFISEQLFNHTKHSLSLNKSIFLFINKKGEASTTSCNDCNFTFNCPSCQLPLIKNKASQLICYHCHHQEDFPPFCPKCSEPNFKSTGLGTQKIEANLKKLFPSANILRFDKDEHTPLNHSSPAIIVGTQFALDKIPWSKINLLGVINASQLWQHSEFMASHDAYQLLTQLLTLAPKNANIVIQTFNPNHSIIQSIIRNKPHIFYSQELKFRQKFNYPPFTNLIKLSYLNPSESKAKKQIQKIYNKINKINKQININPPLPILRRKIRGKYKFNILLKLKNLNDFKSLIKHIPHDWLIDIHPRTLLD